jgi:bifunctional DNase/RNase
MEPMELIGVRLEVPANAPVLMLREHAAPHRVLPIYIGTPEASAIHFAIEGIEPPRPLTHDLLIAVVDSLGATLDKVVITEVREHTFFAELHLKRGDTELTVSCRPSDAVALAVRVNAPIFASHEVLDDAAHVPEEAETDEAQTENDEVDPDEILDEFRSFIDQVNPEDFGQS